MRYFATAYMAPIDITVVPAATANENGTGLRYVSKFGYEAPNWRTL